MAEDKRPNWSWVALFIGLYLSCYGILSVIDEVLWSFRKVIWFEPPVLWSLTIGSFLLIWWWKND